MTTDWKALCAELTNELHKHTSLYDGHESELVARARTALAHPEPVGPTDEELHQLWLDLYAFHDGPTSGDVAEIARAVLARFGRPTIPPIPVSERLPGAEDCDAEGRCWWHAPHRVSAAHWIYRRKGRWPEQQYTHWLPVHALPLPRQSAPAAPAP
jgi:hypothetical protein